MIFVPAAQSILSRLARPPKGAGVYGSKTPLDHLFIVPGNHDVDISGDDRAEAINRLTNWQTDDYKSNVGTISETDIALLRSGEEQFLSFIDDLFGPDRADQYEQSHFVISSQTANGLPDRQVLFFPAKTIFVELKAPGKQLRPLQRKRRYQLMKLGFPVLCIDDRFSQIQPCIEAILNWTPGEPFPEGIGAKIPELEITLGSTA